MDLFTIKRKDSKHATDNMFSSIPSLEDTFNTKQSRKKENALKVKIDLPAAQPCSSIIPDRKLQDEIRTQIDLISKKARTVVMFYLVFHSTKNSILLQNPYKVESTQI